MAALCSCSDAPSPDDRVQIQTSIFHQVQICCNVKGNTSSHPEVEQARERTLSLWPVQLRLRNKRFTIHWAVFSSSTNELKGGLWPVITSMWEAPFPRCYFWIRTIVCSGDSVHPKFCLNHIKVVSKWWNIHGGVIRNKRQWFFVLCCCVFPTQDSN